MSDKEDNENKPEEDKKSENENNDNKDNTSQKSEENKETEKSKSKSKDIKKENKKKPSDRPSANNLNFDDEIENEEGENNQVAISSIINSNKNEDKKEEKKEEKIPPASKEISDNQINSWNWLAHYYFVRNEFVDCLSTLSRCSKNENDFEDFYSLFLRGLIKRSSGEINESLRLFKQSYSMNDNSFYILRETGKNFLLLGKFSMAIEIYDSLINKNEEDWDSIYHKGLCLMNMGQYDEANELFDKANEINPIPEILKAQGKLNIIQGNLEEALQKYESALDIATDDAELLAKIATLKLKLEDSDSALDYFNKAIQIDPQLNNSILGISSIYQFQGDYENAFNLYKLSLKTNPNSATVWNNMGLAFISINKFIYATSCLTKAYYLEPFTWGIAFNLGLALMNVGLYASAFIYMEAAATLKTDDYQIYMFLGIILGELKDTNNALTFYNKALSFGENYLIYFNMTVTYIKNEMFSEANSAYGRFKGCFGGGENDYDDDIQEMMPMIEQVLNQ